MKRYTLLILETRLTCQWLVILFVASIISLDFKQRWPVWPLRDLLGIPLYGFTNTMSFGAKLGVLFWMALGLVTTLPSLQSDRSHAPGEGP